MPRGLADTVRAYQLPIPAPGQLYLSQYNLASNAPIYITPGFGSSSNGQLPPINTGSASYEESITYYCKQASVEAREQS